ncbi:MAG TPA: hypothetical protein VLE44_00420 [Candidatus Saccharimonadales bacterium]|nr:hypothetical protein [Candidatus Saccharimonadales bacterium]
MREYRSRLAEVEEKKSVRSALTFGGLTLLIIILGVIFGIPLFAKFINLFSKNSTTSQINGNTTILLAPTLSQLPEFTNQQSIVVKGSAKVGSTVKIFFGDSSDQVSTDDSGNFATNVGLKKGKNTIYAKVIDGSGNESPDSVHYTVTFTNDPPKLTVTTPSDNQSFFGDKQKTLGVQGQVDPDITVTVNDRIAIVDSSGKFSINYDLQQGDNQLKIIAKDQAGNKKEIDLKVTFNP